MASSWPFSSLNDQKANDTNPFLIVVSLSLIASLQDPLASYDVNNHDEDPMPRYDLIDSNRHGTRCAGEVAAEGNNSICAVGVAFDAGIGGTLLLSIQLSPLPLFSIYVILSSKNPNMQNECRVCVCVFHSDIYTHIQCSGG